MKLQSIQALRGVAVLLVFYYHFSGIERAAILAAGSTEQPLIAGLWSNGFAGVDLFFVISGFIMVFVTGQVKPSLKTAGAFLFARTGRIYPLWWIFLLLMVLYFYSAYGVPLDLEDTLARHESPVWHIAASFLLFPQNDLPLIPVGWSLVHEVYFYLIFSITLCIRSRYRPYFFALWALLIGAGAMIGLARPYATNILTLILHPLTLEFIAGALAAWLVISGRRWHPGLVTVTALILLVAALAYPFQQSDTMLSWGRVLWFGAPTALLVYGAVSLEIAGRIKWPATLTDLGDWSYAFYLSHILTTKGVERLFVAVANRDFIPITDEYAWLRLSRLGSNGYGDNLAFFVSSLGAAIFIAWLTYRFVERPVLAGLGRLRWQFFADHNAQLRPSPIRASVW